MQNIIISRIKKNACIKDKVAIRYRNEVLTYYELNRMSDYVAEKIQKEIAYKKKMPNHYISIERYGIHYIYDCCNEMQLFLYPVRRYNTD